MHTTHAPSYSNAPYSTGHNKKYGFLTTFLLFPPPPRDKVDTTGDAGRPGWCPRQPDRHFARLYRVWLPNTSDQHGEFALQQEENQKARKSNAAEENTRPPPQMRIDGGPWRGRERLEGEGAGERGDAAHAG